MMNQMSQHMGLSPSSGMQFGGTGGPVARHQMTNAPCMGPHGWGFQSIPSSVPMLQQQAIPSNMVSNGPRTDNMQQSRLPNYMMGPGMDIPNGPKKVPVFH